MDRLLFAVIIFRIQLDRRGGYSGGGMDIGSEGEIREPGSNSDSVRYIH